MCKELEAAGLPALVFNNSTFILKVTVMSADWEQSEEKNARIDSKNARIGVENARIDPENAKIGVENAKIDGENAKIENLNPWMKAKNACVEKIKSLQRSGTLTDITSSAIISVIEDLRENQVIGTQDVQKILDCKATKAYRILTEMKKAEVIVAVTGQGKSRYILNIPEKNS